MQDSSKAKQGTEQAGCEAQVTGGPGHLQREDLIFIDFDGTISGEDTVIAGINARELDEAWEIEYQWRRGEIDSMECLARQWGMVDLSPAAIYRMIDSFEMDHGFSDMAEAVIQIGAGLVVVSDGLDFYVDRMLGHIGWETCPGEMVLQRPRHCIPRFANRGVVTDEGIQISFPHRSEQCSQCGNCKLEHLMRLRRHFSRVIYVGDGHSDLCAARFADVVFAKDALEDDFRQAGRAYYPFAELADVNALLGIGV